MFGFKLIGSFSRARFRRESLIRSPSSAKTLKSIIFSMLLKDDSDRIPLLNSFRLQFVQHQSLLLFDCHE